MQTKRDQTRIVYHLNHLKLQASQSSHLTGFGLWIWWNVLECLGVSPLCLDNSAKVRPRCPNHSLLIWTCASCATLFHDVSYWTHYQSLPASKATSPSEFPTELNLDFEVMQPNFFTLQVLFRKDNHALLGQKKTHMAKTYLPRFLNLAGSSSQLEDHRILQLG